MKPSLPILIADDDPAVCTALRLLLTSEGWACQCVTSVAQAQAALASQPYALLLADMNYRRDTTSGEEGLTLLAAAQQLRPQMPVLALTGWGSIGLAVQAMRAGAADFIEKPWRNEHLLQLIRQQLNAPGTHAATSSDDMAWIGTSPCMQSLLQKARVVASADVNIFISGENGSGKTQLAQWLHQHSPRHAQAMVTVNMGAIAEHLFESEMFGHIKGAFTDARESRIGRFEQAHGSTLFLDEIGNLPQSQQAKLLQVLESRRFERLGSSNSQVADIRLICASNADLPQMVSRGSFRRDLLYRINTVELTLPPLRERGADILLLANHYLQHYCQRYRRPLPILADAAAQALLSHDWPGNVRELSHCMERLSLLAESSTVQAHELGLHPSSSPAKANAGLSTLENAEKTLIRQALHEHAGQAELAAAALGLSRSAFYRRLAKYQL